VHRQDHTFRVLCEHAIGRMDVSARQGQVLEVAVHQSCAPAVVQQWCRRGVQDSTWQ
jgi:hypothetical protein